LHGSGIPGLVQRFLNPEWPETERKGQGAANALPREASGGGLNEIELRIDGAADGSNVHYGFIVGGQGGRQESLRFTNGDYDYIVFDGRPGRIFDIQEPYAGLVVLRQGSSVSDEPAFDEKCEGEFQPLQINLENQPKADDDSFLRWRF